MASPSPARLFRPVRLGALDLSHGVVLCPLTRQRSSAPNCVPNALMAEYYSQRATRGGLLISEGTQISKGGSGFALAPGIYTPEQVEGWKLVTSAVHQKGGLFVAQLWHVGRVSNSTFGQQGVAPSAIGLPGNGMTPEFKPWPHEVPHALTADEIAAVVGEFRHAAECAKEAGFDGVELHGANGYLIDQFLHDGSNARDDEYGGSIENRTRFLVQVLEAVLTVWPADRIGVRLSPFSSYNSMTDSNAPALFEHVLRVLDRYRLAYVHVISSRHEESDAVDEPTADLLYRAAVHTPVIVNGGYTRASGIAAVEKYASAVAYGKRFISNPDLPRRLAEDLELDPYDRTTFFGGTAKGYTDYKRHEESHKSE